jgi:hypothetical protein
MGWSKTYMPDEAVKKFALIPVFENEMHSSI